MKKSYCPRRIVLTNVENFRDIGGYPTFPRGMSAYQRIYRSGSLTFATPDDVERIARLKIKTIIDLRSPDEQVLRPDQTLHDSRFVTLQIPVNGHGRLPTDEADVIESYLEMIEEPTSARMIFKAIIAAKKPLLLHCTAGKDRTGVYVALLLSLNGVELADIIADYLLSFGYLRKMARKTLDENPDFPLAVLTPNVRYIEGFFEKFMLRYHSIAEYLELIGLSAKEIKQLTNILK